jgi:hypothetical protein
MNYEKKDLIKVREVLVGVASAREKISYKNLALQANLNWNHKSANDRKDFGRLLADVSSAEYARGRPLLTAVVVRDDTGMPGKGFLGLEGFPKTQEFWETELKRVHDFWDWP